jgi:dihydropteroate synthase
MTGAASLVWRCRDRDLALGGTPRVMGILNVTPDSFSDGGRYRRTEAAVVRGLEMAGEGAALIDVGGESTRPGAVPVTLEEELERVIPVIEALARALAAAPGEPPLISVDTRKAPVADRALKAGAVIVNDVTALAGDPAMAGVVRQYGAGAVLMHMRGEPGTMQENPVYGDVATEVAGLLGERLKALTAAGLEAATLAVDPGIGFGKTVEHNLQLVARLDRLAALGRPVVIGLSRKRFLGKLTGRDISERMAGSLAGLTVAVWRGAHVVRVHDVRESTDAVRVAMALREAMG